MDGMGLAALAGGILLAIVLLWAVMRNNQRTNADRRRTEEATRDLYQRVDRQDKVTDPDPQTF